MDETKGLSFLVPQNKGMLDLMNKSSNDLIKHLLLGIKWFNILLKLNSSSIFLRFDVIEHLSGHLKINVQYMFNTNHLRRSHICTLKMRHNLRFSHSNHILMTLNL